MFAMIYVSFFPCSISNRKILNIQKLYPVLFSMDTFKIAKKKKKNTDANKKWLRFSSFSPIL